MKRLFLTLLFFTITLQAQTVTELRGVWLTNVDSNVLTYDQDITKAIDYLASIGVNVIFPVMWNNGYTLYPSAVMTNLFNRPISPAMAGRDPLKRLIMEAHRQGIEVIPWMEYGFATSYVSGGVVSGDGILTKFPAWASKTNTGGYTIDGDGSTGFVWMSGINPQVQDFLIALSTEILDNYEVDGIQGDDRLPALPATGGYDSTTVAIYKSENGGSNPPAAYQDAAWMRWRADKLNQFFSRFRDSVKARGSNIILSSAPSPYYWGYGHHLQDSKTWVNTGIVDNFIPQIYPNPPARSFSEYQYILQKTMLDIDASKKSITFPGVLAKVGSYVIPQAQIVNCVKENRLKGLKGETYFFYEGIANANKINGDTLKNSVYSQPAQLPYRNGNIWRPKANITNEDDLAWVSTTGLWKIAASSSLGYRPNIIYSNDSNYTSISYRMDVPANGWYGVYVWVEPNNLYSSNAMYKVFTGNDSVIFIVDQTLQKNKGWYKLKDVYLLKGVRTVAKVDNTGLISGRYLMADAVMIMINRKLSPDVVITATEDVKSNNSKEIANFNLESNYPNPVNQSLGLNSETKIGYTLPSSCEVSLKVFDLLGREVSNIFSGYQSAGRFEQTFDTGNLSSGVYIYQLKAGNYSQQKKMIIIK